MRALKCDLCGGLYEVYTIVHTIVVKGDNDLDLCSLCHVSLLIWINSRKDIKEDT